MIELIEGKKELVAVRCPRMQSLFELKYRNGGELPAELQGGYTSQQEAENAARNYLEKKNRIAPAKIKKVG